MRDSVFGSQLTSKSFFSPSSNSRAVCTSLTDGAGVTLGVLAV